MSKVQNRINSLVPNGMPKYVRCYDNGGETADRYTVVFTGRYTQKTNNEYWYLGMSDNPFHPQGIGMHGGSKFQIDRPSYKHLGKKISFEQLPKNCQICVMDTYNDLWDLE